MVEVAAGPSDSAHHEKVSALMILLLRVSAAKRTLTLFVSSAAHGAQSAQVKLLSSGSLRPALLPPGLWGYLSAR